MESCILQSRRGTVHAGACRTYCTQVHARAHVSCSIGTAQGHAFGGVRSTE
jgi:hypothetical protein